MIHVTRRLTAKNRDQLRNPTLGNRVWATFTFLSGKLISHGDHATGSLEQHDRLPVTADNNTLPMHLLEFLYPTYMTRSVILNKSTHDIAHNSQLKIKCNTENIIAVGAELFSSGATYRIEIDQYESIAM